MISKSDDNGIFITFTGIPSSTTNSKALNNNKEISVNASTQVQEVHKNNFISNNHQRANSIYNNVLSVKKQKGALYSFPMMPSTMSVSADHKSSIYLMNHPERPIDKTKKINFTLNPGLYKGRVLSHRSNEILPSTKLNKLYYMLNFDFNKYNEENKNYKWNSPHTARDQIKEEMINRRLSKYKDDKSRYRKFLNNSDKKNRIFNEVVKAKDIVLSKLPRIRNMGYQHMSTEKTYTITQGGIEKKVKNVQIQIG